jgi:hypothetical protein
LWGDYFVEFGHPQFGVFSFFRFSCRSLDPVKRIKNVQGSKVDLKIIESKCMAYAKNSKKYSLEQLRHIGFLPLEIDFMLSKGIIKPINDDSIRKYSFNIVVKKEARNEVKNDSSGNIVTVFDDTYVIGDLYNPVSSAVLINSEFSEFLGMYEKLRSRNVSSGGFEFVKFSSSAKVLS